VGSLKQVTRFLTDPEVKERVLARVSEQVSEDTKVLIGHSLGSIVTYEYLCRYPPRSVRMLVTLGSPLGIPNLIFDRITPAPIDGRGTWPGAVTGWLNVADRNDIVALRKELATLFPPMLGVDAVQDRLVDNGDKPHAIDRYLNAAETGDGLGDALG
jgi:pimeloyl-ACP methyl ester carboxylesterase